VSGILPEMEPGDRWRWAVVAVVGLAVVAAGLLRLLR
jgi:hypothetical protein